MDKSIESLERLYKEYDRLKGCGEDVVSDLKKEINNLELHYLKNQVLPEIAEMLSYKLSKLRCSIDGNIQYDGEKTVNYTFCTSSSMLLLKGSFIAGESQGKDMKSSYPEHIIYNNSDSYNKSGSAAKSEVSVQKNSKDSIEEKTESGDTDGRLNEDQWLKMLISLKCMPHKGKEAPHKAIFILSIIDGIKRGILKENRIFATTSYSETFNRIWNQFVPKAWPFICNAYHPYIHMSDEPFYFVKKAKGVAYFDMNQNWSRSSVGRYVDYAYFDKDLFVLLHNKNFTERLTSELIKKFITGQSEIKATSKGEIKERRQNPDTEKNINISIEERETGRELKISEKRHLAAGHKESIRSKTVSKGMWIIPHSEISFALLGDTAPFKQVLKDYGGYYCNYLKAGEGWVFLNGKKEGLLKEIGEYIVPSPDSTSSNHWIEKLDEEGGQEPERNIEKEKSSISEKQKSNLKRYEERFSNLRSFSFLGVSGPHKAVLLLSILELIKTRVIATPKIYFTTELEECYNNLWKKYIGGTPSLGAAYPFAHLGVETFFDHKKLRTIRDYNTTWNRQTIKKIIPYGMIDKQLFDLAKDRATNKELSKFLISNHISVEIRKHENDKNELKKEFAPATSGINHRENFEKYLRKTLNRNGEYFNDSTINIYLNVLRNDYFQIKAKEVNVSGDIFDVADVKFLEDLGKEMREDISRKRISPMNRTVLNLYIRYLEYEKSR